MSPLDDALGAAKGLGSGLVPTLPDPSTLLASFASAFDQHTRLLKLHFAAEAGIAEGTLLPHRLTGREGVNEGLHYELVALSTEAGLELKTLLGAAVLLEIQSDDGDPHAVCGLVTEVHQEGSDGGFSAYRLVIEDGLSVLRLSRKARVFVDRSVGEITERILSAHREGNPVLAGAFMVENRCGKDYAQKPFWMQYNEGDFDFLRRIWAREGISYVIRPGEGSSPDHPQHTLVLFDDPMDLDGNAAGTVRFHRADGTEARDSITAWQGVRRLQAGSVSRGAWNPDRASLASGREANHAAQGEQGASLAASLEDYRFEPPLEGSEGEAFEARARLRMQAQEGQAKHFRGESSVRLFGVGTWFKLQDHPAHDHDAERDREFVLTELEVEAENNLPADLSSLVGKLAPGGHPERPYRNRFGCVRRGIPVLPAELPAPRPGLLSAKVVGPPGEEAHVDLYGRIKVQFHFARPQDHPLAGALGTDADSAWIRLSRMWSSQGYGASFHPRVGDEVLIQFAGHDPDKPMVVGSISNGLKLPAAFSAVAALPVTKALSGFRSQMHKGTGSNELVFDDSPKELRARLACDHAASQLNLGYLVQPRTGGASFPLGEGFELRTVAYGALRAVKGLLLSTDGGGGDHLDVSPLTSQLDSGLEIAKALSDAAENHKADTFEASEDAKKLKESLEGKNKTGSGDQAKDVAAFSDPAIGLSSPAGIVYATPGSQIIAAGESIHATSGKDTNLAVGKNLVMAVKEAWSVFVATSGIKLFAGKGNVDIQAHEGELSLTADKDLKVFAINGNLDLLAKNGITLATSGAKFELKGGNLTITATNCNIKTAMVDVKAGERAEANLPALPKGSDIARHSQRLDGESFLSGAFFLEGEHNQIPYEIRDEKGVSYAKGAMGGEMDSARVFVPSDQQMKAVLQFDDGWAIASDMHHEAPSEETSGDAPEK